MDPIAQEIHYGLPNQQYVEYVSDNLLGRRTVIDPFAPFLLDKTNELYVPRSNVESELTRSENKLILSNKGGGSTTLTRWLTNEMLYSVHTLRYQTLAVHLSLPEAAPQALLKNQQNSQSHLWTLSQLIALIFDVYWNLVVIEPMHRVTLLPLLRSDREWMLKLHWFYNHYPPRHYQVLHDFELFTWLNSTLPHHPFSPRSEDRDILKEIIRFITTIPFDPRKVFSETFRWPFQKILLILDLTGDMTVEKLAELAKIVQELQHLSLAHLEFKIFLNSHWEQKILEWSCCKSGYVSIYRLPQWDAQELQDILDKRVVAYGGEFRDYAGNITNWGNSLPGLNPAVKYHFRQIVIDGALYGYKQSAEFDTPIHVLKLARGLVAACAGCWRERFPPPLNARQLQEIVELYWQ